MVLITLNDLIHKKAFPLQKNLKMENMIIENKSLFQGQDVLIIGNGFDLDLELKTSYNNFYESDFWPFREPNTLMGVFLEQERNINNWMDLEEKIGEYAIRSYVGDIVTQKHYHQKNKEDFDRIVSNLGKFLSISENGAINKNSTASKVLSAQLKSHSIPEIITFNYTSIKKIAQRLDIQTVFTPYHIHGSLLDNNIILGVGEKYSYNNFKLPETNDFFYKTSSPQYDPPQIAEILDKATKITFFGLSLGGMDAPYFSGLFQNLSKQVGKTITFFTFDDRSRLQILRHLRSVEGINLNDVWTRHRFEFIRTKDNVDEAKVSNYIQRLDIHNVELDI